MCTDMAVALLYPQERGEDFDKQVAVPKLKHITVNYRTHSGIMNVRICLCCPPLIKPNWLLTCEF